MSVASTVRLMLVSAVALYAIAYGAVTVQSFALKMNAHHAAIAAQSK